MPYVLALDQGTTSSRALLFDENGAIVMARQLEFPQIYPQPGYVEHDPEAIWRSQIQAAQACLAQAGIGAGEVAAIGIANQRETTLVWDAKTGEPLHNAIVWQCRRTAPMCAEMRSRGLSGDIHARTGLVVDPYFSGTKIAWLLDNVPGLRRRAERGEVLFGTVDTYLMWRLSGGRLHVTDPSNASRTMLYNITHMRWDSYMLDLLGVPEAMLPEVRPTSAVYGECDASIFGAPIPIAAAAGDQQAALFGQMCLQPGEAKNTYGTGCFVLMNVGPEAVIPGGGLLGTVAWDLGHGPTYAVEGSVFVAGAALQWLRDGLGIIHSAAESQEMAGSVADTAGVYFVPAFVGLGAPYWDPYARGLIVGLTRGTTRAHLIRATLEAICFQSRDVLEAMVTEAGLRLELLRADGGASQNDLLLQLQADLLDVSVERPQNIETTATGAAYLAGLAVGLWRDVEELRVKRHVDRVFDPRLGTEQACARYREWQRAVSLSRGWQQPE
ncbi:MAG: glycerol kinase GlpK [Anaerolineae bacterium]